MYVLHVVVVNGGTDWHTALVFWLLVATAGGAFAQLTGEIRYGEALICDLALAAAGGALLALASRPLGTDPLAGVYGVRVLWTMAGAALSLSLGHEATRLLGRFGWAAPISGAGGPTFLLLWLGGWPSEEGLLEATYCDGLPLKLLADSFHFQTRGHLLPSARAVAIHQVAGARAEADALLLTLAGDPVPPDGSREIRLTAVRPCGRAAALAERIRQRRASGS